MMVQRQARNAGGPTGFVGGNVGPANHQRLHAAARELGLTLPALLAEIAQRAEALPAFLDGNEGAGPGLLPVMNGGTAAGAASQYTDNIGDTAAGAG
jgi:hypothetical protein